MDAESVTLPVRCAHCRGLVTLEYEPGDPSEQPWVCPHDDCGRLNHYRQFPGYIVEAKVGGIRHSS